MPKDLYVHLRARRTTREALKRLAHLHRMTVVELLDVLVAAWPLLTKEQQHQARVRHNGGTTGGTEPPTR